MGMKKRNIVCVQLVPEKIVKYITNWLYLPSRTAVVLSETNGDGKVIIISKYIEISVSRQNQHSGFATSMDPDLPAHPHSLIKIHAVRYQFLYLL
jgi:hypothetical protein